MASTYSPNLRLELIGTGEQQGTWGSTTNTNLGTLLEEAIGGYVSVTVSNVADTTLTENNGSADQSRNMVINLTGTISAARNVICPAIEKIYVVKNATTGGFAVTFKVTGQTGVSIPNGSTYFIYVDGTDARMITGSLANQLASSVSITGGTITGITDLAIADGGTGASNATNARTNLGLGTGDSPTFTGLTLSGVGSFSAGTALLPSISTTGDLNTGMWFPAADTVAWSTGGSERMRITSAGLVGIGTNAPIYSLEVRTAAGTSSQLGIRTENSSASSVLSLGQIGAIGWDVGITATTGHFQIGINGGGLGYNINRSGTGISFHSWFTDGSERMRITSVGNVGIGTNSPGARLDVVAQDAIRATGFQPFLTLRDSSDSNKGSRIQSASGTTILQNDATGGGTYTERMRIDASGNVGIGTSSPGSNRLSVSNSGNCSVSVSGSDAAFITMEGTGFGEFNELHSYRNGVSQWKIAGAGVQKTLALYTDNTERMRVDASGNVVVNTAAVATNATNGFLYVPSCAGTPTGTPTAYTGRVPIVVDTTNNKLYFYSGGQWRDAGP